MATDLFGDYFDLSGE